MGTKLSKANKKAKEDEAHTNGKALPENFGQTSTLPASFRKKGQYVNKSEWTSSLPRNSGSSKGPAKPLDRSASFSKRFRKSCRNWAAQKGLVNSSAQNGKASKISDENELLQHPDNVLEETKVMSNSPQEIPEVIVTEPEKEMDIASLVATLVVEAQKKKMASRAASRAQSRELLDYVPEKSKDSSFNEISDKNEHDNETHDTSDTSKVNIEDSKQMCSVTDADDLKTANENQAVVNEEAQNLEADAETLCMKEDLMVMKAEIEHTSEMRENHVKELINANEEVPTTSDQTTTDSIEEMQIGPQDEVTDEFMKGVNCNESFMDAETDKMLECHGSNGELHLNEISGHHVDYKEFEKDATNDSLEAQTNSDISEASETKIIEDDSLNALCSDAGIEETDQNFDTKESSSVKASLDSEAITKGDLEADEVDFENSLEENTNENVSSNEMAEEVIDDHDQPISGETYYNKDEAENVVTHDLSGNIEKTTEEKYDEEKEADDECHVNVAADEIEFEIHEHELINNNDNAALKEQDSHSEEAISNYADDKNAEQLEVARNVHFNNEDNEKDTQNNDAPGKEISDRLEESELLEYDENISELSSKDVVVKEVSEQEIGAEENELKEEGEAFDDEHSCKPLNLHDSDSTTSLVADVVSDAPISETESEGLMNEILNDIVENVTNESRHASSSEYGCESPTESLEHRESCTSDEETDVKTDDVIQKYVTRDTVSVPSENESTTEKLER